MMSNDKESTSRLNGSKSKGPVSGAGKAISSRNATKHGILSRELILPSEREEEFRELFDQLQSELRPLGTLENTLVERIAIAIWRQRRLVRAETAKTQLRQILKQDSLKSGAPAPIILKVITGVPRSDSELEAEAEAEAESKLNSDADSKPSNETKGSHDELYSEARLFPNDADQISRYQSSLDNELYKAMRALREAQAWRLKTIDVVKD